MHRELPFDTLVEPRACIQVSSNEAGLPILVISNKSVQPIKLRALKTLYCSFAEGRRAATAYR